jgi:iron(III) transport system substrate-binding protein
MIETPTRRLRLAVTGALLLTTVFGTSVAAQDTGTLTVYSGRSEALVAPVLERFTEATGIEVETRYGDTSELAALLLEEGERSPADIFFAQDAGALGAVAAAGLFAPLSSDVLDRVPAGFRDPNGLWTGVSGRARTLVYTTAEDIEPPASVLDLADPSWSGRIGWVPANGSFQAFVTALRLVAGDDQARAWVEGILANDPLEYSSNASAVEGVAAGEVDVALVNHYYLLQLKAEHGDDYPVAQHFFPAGDVGSLVNVAGVGQLSSSDQPDAAARLVEYLLGEPAQRYFAETTYEYPLIEGASADPSLPGLASIETPDVDLAGLADLQGTVDLLRSVGAID